MADDPSNALHSQRLIQLKDSDNKLKWVSTQYDALVPTQAGANTPYFNSNIIPINLLQQGYGPNNRIGVGVQPKKIEVSVSLVFQGSNWVIPNGGADTLWPTVSMINQVRVMVVWDKQANSTTCDITDLLQTTDFSGRKNYYSMNVDGSAAAQQTLPAISASLNVSNRDRFQVIRDSYATLLDPSPYIAGFTHDVTKTTVVDDSSFYKRWVIDFDREFAKKKYESVQKSTQYQNATRDENNNIVQNVYPVSGELLLVVYSLEPNTYQRTDTAYYF